MKSYSDLLFGSILAAGVVLGSGAALAQNQGVAPTANDLVNADQHPGEWLLPTGDYANHRFTTLKQINVDTAHNLHPVWQFSTGVLRGHEGGPLIVGDVMYFATPFPNNVFALDLNHNGRVLWKYEPTQNPNVIPEMCCDTVNRGVAYGDGKIFLHQADNKVVALDAKTGKPVWTTETGNWKIGETGTGAPQVIADHVFVGISGGEFGVRGRMVALNVKDGKIAWVAYSSGPDKDVRIDPREDDRHG